VLPSGPPDPAADTASPPLEIRCFGGLSVAVAGAAIDLTAVKPNARRVLRCLALRSGQPVHREVLIESLWPYAAPAAAKRHLHVLISALRRLLEPGIARGDFQLIVRDDEAYRLNLPPDSWADVAEFDRSLREGRTQRATGCAERAIASFQRALDVYAGDLLPEEGPAEWLLDERELRRAQASGAARELAELLLERGESLSAAKVCERGVYIDRYADALWKLCVTAYEAAGDTAAAESTRRRYERVLGELGIPPVQHAEH